MTIQPDQTVYYFSNGMLGSGSFWGNFEIVD